MQTEDKLFESTCLKKLGLVERKGLDGQAMLYPIEKTQKKLETFEQRALVDRLYKPKQLPDPFLHVKPHRSRSILIILFQMNPRAKKEIQKNMKLENEVQLTHRKHALRSSSQNVTRRDKSCNQTLLLI